MTGCELHTVERRHPPTAENARNVLPALFWSAVGALGAAVAVGAVLGVVDGFGNFVERRIDWPSAGLRTALMFAAATFVIAVPTSVIRAVLRELRKAPAVLPAYPVEPIDSCGQDQVR